MNQNIKATDCFKYDTFSLGLVLLEMAGIDIKNLNSKETDLVDKIEIFKNKYKNSKTRFYIDKLLSWSMEKRWDFIETIDNLIYSKDLDINRLSNEQKKFEMSKFTSPRAIDKFWWSNNDDKKILKDHYFASNGRLSLKIPKEFINYILTPTQNSQISKGLLKKELEQHFLKLENNVVINLIMSILMREKEKNKKSQKQLFRIFVDIYTNESSLPYDLNTYLGNNELEKCKYFYSLFIRKREVFVDEVEYLYRILMIDPSENNFTIRNQYLPNNEYYWPSFTSTSLNEDAVWKYLSQKFSVFQIKNIEILLFEIKVNKNRKSNKLNLMKYSFVKEEKEILLLPYFNFKVLASEPKKVEIKNIKKNFCKICIEEIDRNILDINIVWFDPLVNSTENKQYQLIIREIYQNLYVFTKEEEVLGFINDSKKHALVISCGSKAETFIEKIQNNEFILGVILFVGQGRKQKYESLLGKYNIIKDICDEVWNLLHWIPNKKIIY